MTELYLETSDGSPNQTFAANGMDDEIDTIVGNHNLFLKRLLTRSVLV